MIKLSFQPEQLDKIRRLKKVGKERSCQFLCYTLDLKTGEFYDFLEKSQVCGRRLPIRGFAKEISGDPKSFMMQVKLRGPSLRR